MPLLPQSFVRSVLPAIALFASLVPFSATLATGPDWAINAANTPAGLSPPGDKTVIVAIVDDGVRITHKDLADFIWHNPGEKPGNGVDDDGNGYVDDVNGWDVADDDSDVTPPEDRLEQYSHGTQVAGIVTRVVRRAYGEAATKLVRILPVKGMSDDAARPYVKEGFKGIRYAIDAGADIIVSAWGVHQISRDERDVLDKAEEKGVLIIAAAGNAPQEIEQYPAAHRAAVSVAATDQDGKKAEKSSFGQFVDISAPGTGLSSASATSDSDYDRLEGTSFATGLTAAAATLVSLQNPQFSASRIDACLQTSADAFDQLPAELNGKLGAGKLNAGAAIQCRKMLDPATTEHSTSATKGFLPLRSAATENIAWLIKPAGEFKGIRFRPIRESQESAEGSLGFYSDGSADAKLLAEYQLNEIPQKIFFPVTSVYVVLRTEDRNIDQLLAYEMETIDFSTLYCKGTQKVTDEKILEDGSGPNNYSPGSDCKWLITAPEGQVVQFDFTEFDTEAKTDFIYFFNGAGTHEDIMARFSGPDIPPVLTTWSNQVLMWFVTNKEIQGAGWKVRLRFKPGKNKA